MKQILIFLLLFISIFSFAQNSSRTAYIEKYKHLAIKEMKRCGIPSSITLAQALLESGNGNSFLAKKANNHFGIKCHNSWSGPFVTLDDDKPNEKFRKYADVEESFLDHSDFLTNKTRYAFLFQLASNDYKNWARGLRDAGYATASDYDDRLIKIIEQEQLYLYDELSGDEYKRMLASNISTDKFERRVEIANGKKFIRIEKGDTFYAISQHFDISIRKLRKFNEMDDSEQLNVGQIIYVQRKRRKAASGYDYHLVKEGDNMYSIAQAYAIKLKRLYKLNYLKKGREPQVGERIYMRGKAPLD